MSNVIHIATRRPAAAAVPVRDLNAERMAGLRSLEQRQADAIIHEVARSTSSAIVYLAREMGVAAARELCLRTLERLEREGEK